MDFVEAAVVSERHFVARLCYRARPAMDIRAGCSMGIAACVIGAGVAMAIAA